MEKNRHNSILSQSLLISFVVLGGTYSLILDAHAVFFLIYSCFLFGLDIWIWSRYFTTRNAQGESKPRNNENLKNLLKPESKNSIFRSAYLVFLSLKK